MTNDLAKLAVELELSPQEVKFCEIFWTDNACMGNGTRSYAKAYEISLEQLEGESEQETKRRYSDTSSYCSRLLNQSRIKQYLTLLIQNSFNNQAVDDELAKLIRQNAKLEPKLGAIREFNRLKQRILDKIDLSSNGEPIQFVISESIAKKVGMIESAETPKTSEIIEETKQDEV